MTSQSDSSADRDGSSRPYRGQDSVSRRVLEDILNQVTSFSAGNQGIHVEDMDLLIDVARRFRGIEFQLDPIVIELVRVTLPRQLKNSVQTEEEFAAVTDRVARTLYENPETEKRLRSLWKLLSAVE